jgi:hypothetical protein
VRWQGVTHEDGVRANLFDRLCENALDEARSSHGQQTHESAQSWALPLDGRQGAGLDKARQFLGFAAQVDFK